MRFLLITILLLTGITAFSEEKAKPVTDDSFKEEITDNKGYTLLDMGADWCYPCKQIAPIIDELAKQESLKVTKMNFDKCPKTAEKLEIIALPTVILFKDGKEKARFQGSKSKEDIKAWLKEHTKD